MTNSEDNRFEDFFVDDFYLSLKNHLYNYRLRRSAVRKCSHFQGETPILEVGSGLSPMLAANSRVVYSDLSFAALKALKKFQRGGAHVEADALFLPFATGAFSGVICSEVLEHIPDDRAVLREIARVLAEGGRLILTFPHRRSYFAIDDSFVHHCRRYEISEMKEKLNEAGLEVIELKKVLGPLEKITMIAVILIAARLSLGAGGKSGRGSCRFAKKIISPVFYALNLFYAVLAWFDARIFPLRLASVILLSAVKRGRAGKE